MFMDWKNCNYLHFSNTQRNLWIQSNPYQNSHGIFHKNRKILKICMEQNILSNTPMFITSLFKIAKVWKYLKCPSMDKWIKKIWCVCICVIYIYNIYMYIYVICVYIYTVEYKSKKKGILPFVTTWISLGVLS